MAKRGQGGAKSQVHDQHGGNVSWGGAVAAAFDEIYSKGLWGGADGGGSGTGSALSCGVTAREVLRLVMFKYSAVSLLDAPCGGVHGSWMRPTVLRLKADLPCFLYAGLDVVASVVEQNTKAFAAHASWMHFEQMDLSNAIAQPPAGYDLILSRDALQHLSYPNIARALGTYCRAAGTRLILIGSYLQTGKNKLIDTGGTFQINLLDPPFSFPQPLEVFSEGVCLATDGRPNPIKSMLLWSLPELCASAGLKAFVQTHSNS